MIVGVNCWHLNKTLISLDLWTMRSMAAFLFR